MILQAKELKRLAIYFFYDADGIVDNYVPYMLRDLQKNTSRLLIVCNGNLTAESKKELQKITPEILVRENKGFDVWAYKAGMEYIGWDTLKDLDELVLLNSTIMGPLTPFSTMFEEMNGRDVDFWGITTHLKVGFDPFEKSKYGYIPLHLQSHFIAVRKDMLKSPQFKKYWDERPLVTTYEEAICWHEIIFTKEFADKGFTWQAYVDTTDMEKYTANPVITAPLELVRNRKCPIFKKRSFFHNYQEFLSLSVGNATRDLFDYIRDQTDYDVNLIWENILRTQNLADIKNCLHLNYVIPTQALEKKVNPTSVPKIALVMHIYYRDLIGYCFNYAQSIPKNADVYITTDTEEKKTEMLKVFQKLICNKLVIRVISNRGHDVSALLVSGTEFILDYDYVCFVHDKKVRQLDWAIKGDSFSYQCYENLLKNSTYVENVLDLFEKNTRLGLLMPPPPGFDDYYFTYGFSWGGNFKSTKQLADKMNLEIPMSEEKEPIAPLGAMFWFRPAALKLLFEQNWDYSDFPEKLKSDDGTLLHAIERIYPFVAQQAGYYSAWVLADTFASLDITNKNFMLAEINKRAFQIYGYSNHFGLITTMQSSIIDGTASRNTDRALRALLVQRIKRASPKRVRNFLRKLYYLVRRSLSSK